MSVSVSVSECARVRARGRRAPHPRVTADHAESQTRTVGASHLKYGARGLRVDAPSGRNTGRYLGVGTPSGRATTPYGTREYAIRDALRDAWARHMGRAHASRQLSASLVPLLRRVAALVEIDRQLQQQGVWAGQGPARDDESSLLCPSC